MRSFSFLGGLSLALVLGIGFSGCGGGGGGSSSGSTSGLSFPSNAVKAKPTLENGKKVKDVVATNQARESSGLISGLNSIDTNSKLNTALFSSKISTIIFKHTKNINLQSYSLNEAVNQTYNCSGGGTISYNGNGDDINGGTITMVANNCSEYDVKMNGSVYATIGNYDSSADDFKDYTIKYTTDFDVAIGNSVIKIFKNSYEAINITKFDEYGGIQDFKFSETLKATAGSESYGVQDGIYYFKINNVNDLEMYQTSGKVYINNLASYVNCDTTYDMSKTPFVFSGYSGTLQSGEARYNMSGSGKVKIVVESNEAKTYVDADGDGTYELHE